MPWLQSFRRRAARNFRSVAEKETSKYVFLTLATLFGSWGLALINALFHLKPPLTLDTLPDRASELAKLVWEHPYDWTIGLIRNDPVHSVVGLFISAAYVAFIFLLRRSHYQIQFLTKQVSDAAVIKALVAQAGLGGRWPHARLYHSEGASWADLCKEITRHDAGILYILCGNGFETFGEPRSPLYSVMQNFPDTMRVILAHPDSEQTVGRAAAVSQPAHEYKKFIEKSVSRLHDLSNAQRNIEARYYKWQPNWKLIITSRTSWVQYYVPGKHVAETPVWRFDATENRTGLYHIFHMEFDRIWNRCKEWPVDLT